MLMVEMKGFLSIVAASNLTLVQSIFIQQKISAPAPDPQNNFGAATLSNTIYQCVAEPGPPLAVHQPRRLHLLLLKNWQSLSTFEFKWVFFIQLSINKFKKTYTYGLNIEVMELVDFSLFFLSQSRPAGSIEKKLWWHCPFNAKTVYCTVMYKTDLHWSCGNVKRVQ